MPTRRNCPDGRTVPVATVPRPGQPDPHPPGARRKPVLPLGSMAGPVRPRPARPSGAASAPPPGCASIPTRTRVRPSTPSPGSSAPSAAAATGTAPHDRDAEPAGGDGEIRRFAPVPEGRSQDDVEGGGQTRLRQGRCRRRAWRCIPRPARANILPPANVTPFCGRPMSPTARRGPCA